MVHDERHPLTDLTPILRTLDSIECRDALLDPDGKGGLNEAEWPAADFIVGNPPFLGGKLLRAGSATPPSRRCSRCTTAVFPPKRNSFATGSRKRGRRWKRDEPSGVGLVATNSIRGWR